MTPRPPHPVIALDVPTRVAAEALVARLGEGADFYKVGLELFTAEGPDVVRALQGAGKRVFLDLKLHDIPNTVRGAARSAARLGVELLTVHGIGGAPMLRAAVEGWGEGGGASRGGILAVTVLTSMDRLQLEEARGHAVARVEDEVLRLAGAAAGAGCHGIVCSGAELAAVRAAHGDGLAPLVPGIRLAGGATHDQARVMTPSEAARLGAGYVVVGRAVTAAEDPVAALELVKEGLL